MSVTAKDVIDIAREKHVRLGTIESMTGGMIASALTSVPGSSEVFIGSVVSYNVFIKEKVVGVPSEAIEKFGVVSSVVAYEMASHGKEALDVDFCLSVTGNAGPAQENDNKGVGTVHMGITIPEHVFLKEFHYQGDRSQIREQAVQDALELFYEFIKDF